LHASLKPKVLAIICLERAAIILSDESMSVLLKQRLSDLHFAGAFANRRWRKRYFASAALCAGLGFFVFGFTQFVAKVDGQKPPVDVTAQGIVVLTGGRDRLALSLDILRTQAPHVRLLISGVHPDVSIADLAAQVPEQTDTLTCCVDLGRNAVSTAGNAWETRDWVYENSLSNILLVTSNYHMPRSMMELQRALPHTKIDPYPLLHSGLQVHQWWQNSATAELLFKEYLKYLASYLRSMLPSQAQNFASWEKAPAIPRG